MAPPSKHYLTYYISKANNEMKMENNNNQLGNKINLCRLTDVFSIYSIADLQNS